MGTLTGVFSQEADIESYTPAVLDYINFCTEAAMTTRTNKVFPNQKPWFNHKVRFLLQAMEDAFRSGHIPAYSIA